MTRVSLCIHVELSFILFFAISILADFITCSFQFFDVLHDVTYGIFRLFFVWLVFGVFSRLVAFLAAATLFVFLHNSIEKHDASYPAETDNIFETLEINAGTLGSDVYDSVRSQLVIPVVSVVFGSSSSCNS